MSRRIPGKRKNSGSKPVGENKMIDLHCHILPGLDDGARDMDHAIAMARISLEEGVTSIVATPHLFKGGFEYDDLGVIEAGRRDLVAALETVGVPVEIRGGAEVHISHNLADEIRRHREILTVAGTSYVLIEFPSDHVFSGAKDLLFKLMSERVIPIIAHPERNSAFSQSPGLLFELVEMGALAQVNGGSLLGQNGSQAGESARLFLESGLIHFLASDGHNTRTMAPRLAEAVRKAAEIVGEEPARALVEANPQAVLDDEDIPCRPDPVNPQKKRRKLVMGLPGLFKSKK